MDMDTPPTSPTFVSGISKDATSDKTTSRPLSSGSFSAPPNPYLRRDSSNISWSDPELKSIDSLEHFSAHLIHSLDTVSVAPLIRRLDLTAFDVFQCSDLLSSIIALAPNLLSLLIGASPANPLDISVLQTLTGESPIPCRLQSFAVQAVKAPSSVMAESPSFSSMQPRRASAVDSASNEVLLDLMQQGLHQVKALFSKLEVISLDITCVDPSVLTMMSTSASSTLKKVEIMSKDDAPVSPAASDISQALLSLISQCQGVESLNLEGFLQRGGVFSEDSSNAAMLAVARYFPKLRSLKTPRYAIITSELLNNLLTKCPLLEDLALQNVPPASEVESVNILKSLMDHAQSLRNLSIGVQEVKPGQSSDSLAAADLSGGFTLHVLFETSLFEFLERRGRSVRGLEIWGWPSSDRLLRTIAKHCVVLDLLKLSPCSGVRSEAAVRDLLTRMRALKFLRLENTLPSAAMAADLAFHEIKGRDTGPPSGWAPYQGDSTWVEIEDIVKTQTFERFSRRPEVTNEYIKWRANLPTSYASVVDFIKIDVFKFPFDVNSEGRRVAASGLNHPGVQDIV
ncbi:hypothetical protein HDU97_008491 [Phlyctochytrium planicorne]|nr:hypothetical protein HDU97_008491 [Phlyctochytrium planicorne]